MLTVELTVEDIPQEEVVFDTLTDLEARASHVYYAKNAIKQDAITQVVSGDIVGEIPDKIGDKTMFRSEQVVLALGDGPRFRKYSDVDSYISVLNVPKQMFLSEQFDPYIDEPREVASVIAVFEGQSFEQFWDAFITGDGFGDNGTVDDDGVPLGFVARVANQNYVDGSLVPFYKKILVQICYQSNLTRLWVNGVFQGEAVPDYTIPKQRNGAFVDTNNVDHHWFAQYHYDELLSDADRAEIAEDIMAKWQCDELPQYAHAFAIGQEKIGTTWHPVFQTRNPSGNGVGTIEYQWVINIRREGSFEYQKVIATTETLANSALVSALAAYKTEIGSTNPADEQYLFVRIKCYDNNNMGWEYLRGVDYTEVP